MARVFISGAEADSVNEFATPGAGCSIITSSPTPRSGNYAVQGTSTNAVFDFPTYSKTTMYYSFYMQIAANPAATNTFFQLVGAGGLLTLRLTSAGKIQLVLGASAGTVLQTSTNSVPLNAWCRVDVRLTCSLAGAGVLEVRFANTNDDQITETLTSTGQTTAEANVQGAAYGFRTAAQTITFDDIREDDAGYPAPGKVIARQAVTGTPTYDSWTKIGSDPYIGETPFS